MIDYGLLVSMLIAFGMPTLIGNWRLVSGDDPVDFLDVAVGPAFVDLAMGRLATLALDDPNPIGGISDMLIIPPLHRCTQSAPSGSPYVGDG